MALQRIAAAAQGLNQEQSAEGAAKISDRLIELIELQTLEAQRQGGRMSLDKEAHARYIKAALADEFLLALDWEGRGYWRQWLLEERLFNSSQAGEKIFHSVDAILSSRDPSHRGVSHYFIYTRCRSVFRGSLEAETSSRRLRFTDETSSSSFISVQQRPQGGSALCLTVHIKAPSRT